MVLVPVSDVDRAKAFYAEQLGFNVDHDVKDAKVTGGSGSFSHPARVRLLDRGR